MGKLGEISKACESLIKRGIPKEKRIYPGIIQQLLPAEGMLKTKFDPELELTEFEMKALSNCPTSHAPIGIVPLAISKAKEYEEWRKLLEGYEERKFEYKKVNFVYGIHRFYRPLTSVCYIILTGRNLTYSEFLPYLFDQIATRISLPYHEKVTEILEPYFEEEKEKPYVEDEVEAFEGWLIRFIDREGAKYTDTLRIDGLHRTVKLNGRVWKFYDFPEDERAVLENIEFCQGEPVIEKIMKLVSQVKKERLYEEFMDKRKEYERNFLALYLTEQQSNITIGLSRIRGVIYESLSIANHPIL